MATNDGYSKLLDVALDEWYNENDIQNMSFANRTITTMASKWIERKNCGKQFRSKHALGRNTSYKGFGPRDTFNTSSFGSFPEGLWEMKEHVITLDIPDQEKIYNNNEYGILDLAKFYTETTDKSLADSLGDDWLLSNGEGDDGKRGHGFALLFGDATSDAGRKVGDMLASQYPFHQAVIKRPSLTLPVINLRDPMAAWTTAADTSLDVTNPFDSGDTDPWQLFTLDGMDEYLALQQTLGNDVTWCLTTDKIFRRVKKLIRASDGNLQTVTLSSGTISVPKIQAINYQGVIFTWDYMVPDGEMYFGNDSNLKIRVHADAWLRKFPSQRPHNQGVDYGYIYAWWQMYTNKRNALGRWTKVSHKA